MKRLIGLLTVMYLGIPALSHSNSEYDPNEFLKPLTLTNEGIKYFAWCYNQPNYTRRFLPTCPLPIIDLLSCSKDQSDPYSFACMILSTFHQRMKDCRWINPYALAQLLDELPKLLSSLPLSQSHQLETLHALIAKKIQDEKSILDSQPDVFIGSLAQDIQNHLQSSKSFSDVQNIAVRFVEGTLDKLIWDNQDTYAWKTFKLIGSQLQSLFDSKLIPDSDTLNHLLWSLIHRFRYFIDLSGSGIQVDTYLEIKIDIENSEAVPFLNVEEPEKFILPKKAVLLDSIRFGEAKSRLYPKGVLSDSVV